MKKALFVLGQLNDADIEWLAREGRRDAVSPRTALIRENARNDNLYIVLSGTMSVVVAGGSGGEREIARLGAGEIVGEVTFVDGSLASATVVANESCVVLTMPHGAITRRLDEDPTFSGRFYLAIALFLSDRLRSAMNQLERAENIRAPSEDDDAEEVHANVLENVHLAGDRFLRILQALQGN